MEIIIYLSPYMFHHAPYYIYYSVAIDASSYGFQFYSKGVYTDDSCSCSKLNHGVLVTGYGVSNNQAYWTVKNRSVHLCIVS